MKGNVFWILLYISEPNHTFAVYGIVTILEIMLQARDWDQCASMMLIQRDTSRVSSSFIESMFFT